jgi:hypothetical protein
MCRDNVSEEEAVEWKWLNVHQSTSTKYPMQLQIEFQFQFELEGRARCACLHVHHQQGTPTALHACGLRSSSLVAPLAQRSPCTNTSARDHVAR